MSKKVLCSLCFALAGALLVPAALADNYAVGYVSYDVTSLGVAQFDINNQTGGNSSLDSTFPITTPVTLSNLKLDVKFASGPDELLGSSYFTLNSDGISWDGTPLSTGIGQPNGLNGAISAILTGTFSPTSLTLFDSSTIEIGTAFSATITDLSGLTDGDFAIIYATTAAVGPPPTVPEPTTWLLMLTGLAGILLLHRRRLSRAFPRDLAAFTAGKGASIVCTMVLVAAGAAAHATTSVRLNAWTVPGQGAAGSTTVTLTGSNFPSGTIMPSAVTLSFSSTCGGSVAATTSPTTVSTILGSSDRLTFLVPGSLATGTYFISASGTSASSVAFASSNCAEINVSHTSTTLSACLPSSSMAVMTGKNVVAYIPNGSWGSGTTGVSVVPIEGSGTATTVSTPNEINSCSSNSATGQTVCVDNLTNVYEITGSTLTHTLTTSSDRRASFSGGSCNNCGVAIDALSNTAVIAGGFSGNSSGDGLQLLNLNNNTFSTPYPSAFDVSENVSIDPNRNLILSPGEDSNYTLFKIQPNGSLQEYSMPVPGGGDFDSAAEDCTTGIALSTQEFTNNLYIVDLTQATFTAPSGGHTYGTWTAPGQSVNLYPSDDFNFSAGTSGISVAAGTTHLGIVTGEFGGSTFAAFQLPSTSGSGTPTFVDWVGASLPNTPDGAFFSAGFDPHTITAYTSPNDGKAYGLIADWATGKPDYVAVIDLQALMSASRSPSDSHIVNSSVDLLATGIVRYIAIP